MQEVRWKSELWEEKDCQTSGGLVLKSGFLHSQIPQESGNSSVEDTQL